MNLIMSFSFKYILPLKPPNITLLESAPDLALVMESLVSYVLFKIFPCLLKDPVNFFQKSCFAQLQFFNMTISHKVK